MTRKAKRRIKAEDVAPTVPVPEEPMPEVVGLWEKHRACLHRFDALGLGTKRASISLGRARSNTIQVVDDSHVSLKHCEIVLEDGSYVLRDVGSTNGTHIDHSGRVTQTVLRPDMMVRLGKSKFLVMGIDTRVPITARSPTSFLAHGRSWYGSNRQAGENIGRHHTTIGRARKRLGK